MTSNYYIKIGSNSYSFNDIFNAGTGIDQETRFYDNYTEVTTKYKNIIATDNLQIKHTSVNYIYGSIDISQYLLPKFQEFTTPSTGTPPTGTSVTVPAWCTTIQAIIIGSGAGGGGENVYEIGGNGGGGGYGYTIITRIINLDICTVIVGSGGNGGYGNSSGNSNHGDNGNTSSVNYNSLTYSAYGGTYGGISNGSGVGPDGTGGGYSSNNTSGFNGSGRTSGFINITHQSISGYGIGGYGGGKDVNVNDPRGTAGSNGYVRLYFCK